MLEPNKLPSDDVGMLERCVVGAIQDAMEELPALEKLSARDPGLSDRVPCNGLAPIVNGNVGRGCVMAGRGGV